MCDWRTATPAVDLNLPSHGLELVARRRVVNRTFLADVMMRRPATRKRRLTSPVREWPGARDESGTCGGHLYIS
jgi:hypothetical protein